MVITGNVILTYIYIYKDALTNHANLCFYQCLTSIAYKVNMIQQCCPIDVGPPLGL